MCACQGSARGLWACRRPTFPSATQACQPLCCHCQLQVDYESPARLEKGVGLGQGRNANIHPPCPPGYSVAVGEFSRDDTEGKCAPRLGRGRGRVDIQAQGPPGTETVTCLSPFRRLHRWCAQRESHLRLRESQPLSPNWSQRTTPSGLRALSLGSQTRVRVLAPTLSDTCCSLLVPCFLCGLSEPHASL